MDYITEFIAMMISASTAILLAALGEIYAERSGVLNLGVEGMMAVGATIAFYATLSTGNIIIGLLSASISGMLLSLIHGFISITIRSNQVISGLALSMMGLGISSLIGRNLIGTPLRNSLGIIEVALLSDIPVIGAFFRQNALTFFSYILTAILWYILFKTKIGIAIRMVGDNPKSADSLGINVYTVRYRCTLLGGALAGLAGAYLSVAYTPTWIEGMTAGQGWIALALTVFSAWNPLYALIGSYLFGGIRILQFRLQPLGLSPPLLSTLPYLFTIISLALLNIEKIRWRIGAPQHLGKPYHREEA
ncbi:MAG: ABC transporter permease [Nitrososphaerota archaeon]|nr:ABC transporter permease [Candidatus Bathyarchaeota archaeon]MDW8061751.1 ABC transporter permease [Nitrososphaerota archaeon]